MNYLESQPELRSRPAELLTGAKSVIALALNYAPSSGFQPKAGEGKVSRYTAGKDYHKVIGKKLAAFTRYLEALSPGAECRTFVDTGPLLERGLAQRAGLGFIGKNTMLITKGMGSWVFLASVITTLELPIDAPDNRSCGECRICIDACPTEAITAPYELDARRCIAYLTIEQDRPIPEKLAGQMQGWVFGCDICQEVCPHNSASPRQYADEAKYLALTEILSIRSDEEFRGRFAGTAFMRAGREGLVRNACVAAANLGRKDLVPLLDRLSRQDPHAVVREQAAWALQRLC